MLIRGRHLPLLTVALCLILAAEGLLSLGFRSILYAEGNHLFELSGTWVMTLPNEMRETGRDVALLPHGTLTLRDDGTFTQHMENYVMTVIVMDSTGKYTRSGDTITLTGASVSYSDDGYAKGTQKEPLVWRLKYAHGTLTTIDDQAGAFVFRREGYGVSSKPRSLRGGSDLKAVQIVEEVQRRYAALNTYSDQGALTSSGDGSLAKNARFGTRFVRPLKFLYQFAQVINGEELGKMVVWSDNQQTWLYGRAIGRWKERGLDEAFYWISPKSGDESMLVPMLLLPDEIRAPKLDDLYAKITLLRNRQLSGTHCYEVGLSNPGGMHLRLWIGKSDYLIRRAYNSSTNTTITYQPKANARISDAEFKFSPP